MLNQLVISVAEALTQRAFRASNQSALTAHTGNSTYGTFESFSIALPLHASPKVDTKCQIYSFLSANNLPGIFSLAPARAISVGGEDSIGHREVGVD